MYTDNPQEFISPSPRLRNSHPTIKGEHPGRFDPSLRSVNTVETAQRTTHRSSNTIQQYSASGKSIPSYFANQPYQAPPVVDRSRFVRADTISGHEHPSPTQPQTFQPHPAMGGFGNGGPPSSSSSPSFPERRGPPPPPPGRQPGDWTPFDGDEPPSSGGRPHLRQMVFQAGDSRATDLRVEDHLVEDPQKVTSRAISLRIEDRRPIIYVEQASVTTSVL